MGTDTGLFSEVYGCYFMVVAKILEQAQGGMTRTEIEGLVNSEAFGDSIFHMLPKLFSDEWSLLERKTDGKYYSRLKSPETGRPMTGLEKSWIKALLLDKRIQLFVRQDEMVALDNILADIPPLFSSEDFHIFDSALDGDSYSDENYIENFRTILSCCVSKKLMRINYESGKRKRLTTTVLPYKISYSARDDKFRLHGVILKNGLVEKPVIHNLARIRAVEVVEAVEPEVLYNVRFEKYFDCKTCAEPIVLEIYKERSALERCMLQLAAWEKQTEYDEERDCYTCRIYYDGQDETELLIRILSFGPVVKVLGPEGFLAQVKERVINQYGLNVLGCF